MRALLLALILFAAAGASAQVEPDTVAADTMPAGPSVPVFDSSGVMPGDTVVAAVVVPRSVPVRLGETALTLEVHAPSDSAEGVRYLVVHDDENTAVAAGLAAVQAGGGRLVELHAQGERYVTFRHAGREWSVDPNRIYTDAGARRTLRDRNGSAPAVVVLAVRRFAEAVIADYGAPPVVVALHNNTEDNYSAASYRPGGSEAAEAAAVTIPAGADPDDFFFTTDRALYDAIAAEGFSVVLQNNAGATDDGSLSVWAAQRGRPYVNVEAQHGHEREQRRMLDALSRILARWNGGEGR